MHGRVEFIGGPGSLTFLALCLIAGFVLLKRLPRRRVLGRTWLGLRDRRVHRPGDAVRRERHRTLAAAMPICRLGVHSRRGHGHRPRRRQSTRARAGSAGHFRSRPRIGRLGLRRYLDARSPSAGGHPVPPHIRYGGNPLTTQSQMERVRTFLAEGHRAALIASRLQLPRVTALAAAFDLHVPLIASPIDDEPPTAGVARFVPTYHRAAHEPGRDLRAGGDSVLPVQGVDRVTPDSGAIP